MTAGFSSNPELLKVLLDRIHNGEVALPEFQRGWRWDVDRIMSLLASIAQGFPIGTLMTLETGGDIRFKMRPIEGAPPLSDDPDLLVLDGQQRMTSLYQVLRSGNIVGTTDPRKKPIDRWFYIDINAAIDDDVDFEDAIVTVDASKRRVRFDRTVEIDVSTVENEWDSELFPLALLFDIAGRNEWQNEYRKAASAVDEVLARVDRWNTFQQSVLQAFELYKLPVIELQRSTSREAVCRVFEKVNTGGIPLDVFELVTASFAAEEFDLRADWKSRQVTFARNPYLANVLKAVQNTDFIQAISLVVTHEARRSRQEAGVDGDRLPAVSCKRKDILRLLRSDYEAHADAVTAGFIEAAQFLHQQHLYSERDLPYRTQLVPMAASLALLGTTGKTDTARRKLARWYWCGVFGELYGGAIETRFARDVQELVEWVRGADVEPKTLTDSSFTASRFFTLRTRNSAAYKGLHALLMRDGCLDFIEGKPIDIQTFTDAAIDIHHVFPQRWCKDRNLDLSRWDSIVNKTPLSAATNRVIGGRAPSHYLPALERRAEIATERMDELLMSHAIEAPALRADDFDAFFMARAAALIDRIEAATGRAVIRDLDELVLDEDKLIDYEDEPEVEQ